MNKEKKEHGYVFDPFDLDKRLEYSKRRVINSGICEEDKKLILEYCDYIQFKKKLSKERVDKWLNTLIPLSEMLGLPFDKAGIKDMERLDKKILESHYADNSKCDLERMLKKFYKWVKSPDKNTELDDYPSEIKWIKAIRPQTKPLRNEDVISWDDVIAMSLHCQNHRDRAFLKSLWESSNRIREHLMLRIGDVEEDDYGLNLNVKITKTGGKTVQKFLTLSAPDLTEWLQYHPKANDPKAPLWVNITKDNNACMSYFYARKLLSVLGKKAGIKKKLNPHNFRHGSLSFWSDHLTDSQIKYKAGWSQGTRMLDVYIHKDVNAIKERVLQLQGIKTRKDESPLDKKMVNCYFCGKPNDISRLTCYNCKRFLDMRKNKTLQQLRDNLDDGIIEFTDNHPEFLLQYLNFLRERYEKDYKRD